ncbi:MAG: DNA ligase, partial [Acholeplasmataceae bacterium]|nr:DNA ligase [Acholeplasmataceae bacterium]
ELKFDGIRALGYLDINETVLINKRGKNLNPTYPELINLHEMAKGRMIIDGELVVMKTGKPDFFALQRRSLLTDPLKIDLQRQLNPVCFIVFDLLYLRDKLIIDLPLWERKKLLEENVQESKYLLISRYIEENGQAFFELVQKEGLEGIVAKEKTSRYYPGKRSSVWLKVKVYQEEDLVICGYIPKDRGVISLILGRYTEGKLIKAGTVVSSKNKTEIFDFAHKYPERPLFELSEKAIWMKPYLVGRVRYMEETKTGGLRQPVFMGIRDDKTASDLDINK